MSEQTRVARTVRVTGHGSPATNGRDATAGLTVDAVMLDLDGCVWFGSELAPRAAETIAELREAGLGVGFLTNISSGTTTMIADKLTSLGIPTHQSDVLMPIVALAGHPLLATDPLVYVLGREEVAHAVAQVAATTTDEDAADLVVVGRDPDLRYSDLAAAVHVLTRGGKLLALNLDTRVPIEGGRVVPGNGAIAAALTAATGVVAESVGKPSRYFFDVALERFGFDRRTTLMVGDTLDSDIAGGAASGLVTVQVGGSRFSTLDPFPVPDHSLTQLADLPRLLFSE
jgi:HAD superfamily hydrolase (TIGR01450 family)